MASLPDRKGEVAPGGPDQKKGSDSKLGTASGVYIPVFLNVLSILMFLRFGQILGQIGFVGIIILLAVAYSIDLLTVLSLSAIASNGEVKGGGAYYLISRSLGPEFGGSIGILFFLAQVLNTAMNVVGFVDCIRSSAGDWFPRGYWEGYGLETATLFLCTCLCLLGSSIFSKASNALLAVLALSLASIPLSALFRTPFTDDERGVVFTGVSINTFADNFLPHPQSAYYNGVATFRELFGILFSATSGIFAGASMSGDLKNPSKAIPKGTLWAMVTTFFIYFVVVVSLAATTTRASLIINSNIVSVINLSSPVILAGECAVTLFSILMGMIGSAKLFQALSKDKLLPGLSIFEIGHGSEENPLVAIILVYFIAQLALFADLDQIATFISMGYQMTFFVMNLACFLLKIGSAPNFRPGFKFFNWETALIGSLSSAAAMFFIEETYAAMAILALIFVFLLIHYLCPPKRWGDVSQNLIYHQVRKYLLRLRPEHIKFWRPHIILLINDPRRQTRLIQFCNSLKKGSLYILGHVIVTDDFNAGVHEAKLQQQAWTNYISEFSRIKAFVQLTMSPSITWGVRNLILSAGLGGMRPNIAVLGFYNMNDLRKSKPPIYIPDVPNTVAAKMKRPARPGIKTASRRRGDTSARLLEGSLPTDVIRTEEMMSPTHYMTMLEDLALKYRLNVAVAYGFETLETPRKADDNTKRYVDLWPIQMSAEVSSDGKNVLTTNFDTYTLILQLGHILRSVKTWRSAYTLRVMVFVEYESEVEEESARVKALLDKLRIDGDVKVFWLASGLLNTYELIVNGKSWDIDWEILINDALRDEEWWDDLQTFRGRIENMSSSQELKQLARIIDSTVGRPGTYNPHGESISEHRRPSMPDFPQLASMPKNPGISLLSRMGVNVGIHTHHLNDNMLQDLRSEEDSQSESSESEDQGDGYQDNLMCGSQGPNAQQLDRVLQPLLQQTLQRNDEVMGRGEVPRPYGKRGPQASQKVAPSSSMSTYGTMGQTTNGSHAQRMPKSHSALTLRLERGSQLIGEDSAAKIHGEPKELRRSQSSKDEVTSFPAFGPFQTRDLAPPKKRNPCPASPSAFPNLGMHGDEMAPTRPVMSHQGSATKFSSRPVPEAQVVTGGDGSKLSFAEAPFAAQPPTPSNRSANLRQSSQKENTGSGVSAAFGATQTPNPQAYNSRHPDPETPKAVGRPTHSRQSSYGRFSSRPVPESRVSAGEDVSRTISFAERPLTQTHSAAHSRHHSRQNSNLVNPPLQGGDVALKIPELIESYKLSQTVEEETEGGLSYSPQEVALSFNDLPSRAQHLVLNELIRKHSTETAVLLSTLPIPSDGTSLDENASIQYLSDVEVLCNGLPPTLLVLSNNMTVTVGL